MKLKAIIANGWCVGCGMCAAACPKDRLDMRWNDRGEYNPVERVGCDTCGEKCDLCFSVCPVHGNMKDETEIGSLLYGNVHGIQHRDETGYYLTSYVGYADRDHLRENGASGGMATWTLETLLESGEVDAVAAVGRTTNPEKFFEFRICNTTEEVRQCSRSAYYPVEISVVIRHILQNEGRYAIIGLPCVCKAIRLAQEKFPKLKERIRYVLGLVCGHTCSKYFAEYICALGGGDPHKIREFIFRTKSPNQPASNLGFSFRSGDDSEEKSKQILWQNGVGFAFTNSYFQILGCFYCDDLFAECADAVFMDAWLPRYSLRPEGHSIALLRDASLNKRLDTAMKAGMPIKILPIDQAIRSQRSPLNRKRKDLWVHICQAKKRGRHSPQKRYGFRKKVHSPFSHKIAYLHKQIADKSVSSWQESKKQLSTFQVQMYGLTRSIKFYQQLRYFLAIPLIILKRIIKKLTFSD